MRLLTGNDLATGDVIWWTGDGWSRLIAHAIDVGDGGDAVARREEAARRVNGAYVIDAVQRSLRPVPVHIKERIRAAGPTVRPDLGIQAAETSDEGWVI